MLFEKWKNLNVIYKNKRVVVASQEDEFHFNILNFSHPWAASFPYLSPISPKKPAL